LNKTNGDKAKYSGRIREGEALLVTGSFIRTRTMTDKQYRDSVINALTWKRRDNQ